MSNTVDKGQEKTLLNYPFKWLQAGLNSAAKALRFTKDEENNVWATPVMIIGVDSSLTSIQVNNIAPASTDAVYEQDTGLFVRSANYVYNPASAVFERLRTPTVFKTINHADNSIIVWSPAAGKKFRLMGGIITLAGPAKAAAAYNSLNFTDNAVAMFTVSFYCPLAAASLSTYTIPFTLPGNGYLSAVADNDLICNFGAAITAGSVALNVWGTEE